MKLHNVNWEKKCIDICLDGACPMSGKHDGVFGKIKEVAPEAKFVPSCIHREALASKNMNVKLKIVLRKRIGG